MLTVGTNDRTTFRLAGPSNQVSVIRDQRVRHYTIAVAVYFINLHFCFDADSLNYYYISRMTNVMSQIYFTNFAVPFLMENEYVNTREKVNAFPPIKRPFTHEKKNIFEAGNNLE